MIKLYPWSLYHFDPNKFNKSNKKRWWVYIYIFKKAGGFYCERQYLNNHMDLVNVILLFLGRRNYMMRLSLLHLNWEPWRYNSMSVSLVAKFPHQHMWVLGQITWLLGVCFPIHKWGVKLSHRPVVKIVWNTWGNILSRHLLLSEYCFSPPKFFQFESIITCLQYGIIF